jgi:hypothetical protein
MVEVRSNCDACLFAFGSALAIVSVFGSHKGKARGIVEVQERSRATTTRWTAMMHSPRAWSLLQ